MGTAIKYLRRYGLKIINAIEIIFENRSNLNFKIIFTKININTIDKVIDKILYNRKLSIEKKWPKDPIKNGIKNLSPLIYSMFVPKFGKLSDIWI